MEFITVPFNLNGKPVIDCGPEKLAMKVEDLANELGCKLIETNVKI